MLNRLWINKNALNVLLICHKHFPSDQKFFGQVGTYKSCGPGDKHVFIGEVHGIT